MNPMMECKYITRRWHKNGKEMCLIHFSPKWIDLCFWNGRAWQYISSAPAPKFTMNKPRNRNVKNRGAARSKGRPPRLPNNGAPQQLTNPKFMSRPQRLAYACGVEIWV